MSDPVTHAAYREARIALGRASEHLDHLQALARAVIETHDACTILAASLLTDFPDECRRAGEGYQIAIESLRAALPPVTP